MTKRVEHELTNQVTVLTADEMECIAGGSLVSGHNEQVVVHYHPITSPGTTMYRPPSKKRA
jgi:hypothetical protein